DQLATAADANMRFPAEIPLLALLGLMHLRVASLGAVLGRRWRSDDRGIHDRAGGDLQPLGREMPLHLIEQPPAQIVLFEQVAEAAHRGLVGHGSRPRSILTKRRIASGS